MTEQPPELPSSGLQPPDPSDIHAVLRHLRGMFDGDEPQVIQSPETPDRPIVDASAALRAVGITEPDFALPEDQHIDLRYGEDRLYVGMTDRTRNYVEVILGEGDPDALSVVAGHDYTRHPGTDVVIPLSQSGAATATSVSENMDTNAPTLVEGGRHAKKRSLRHRFALGATALVASAAALFGLTGSEGPVQAPSAPQQMHELPPKQTPKESMPQPTSRMIVDEQTGDTISTVRSGGATTVTVEMGAINDGGPWAMTAEALAAADVTDQTNAAIAAANPWMKNEALRAEARTLQAGTTVQYHFQDGRLTSVSNVA